MLNKERSPLFIPLLFTTLVSIFFVANEVYKSKRAVEIMPDEALDRTAMRVVVTMAFKPEAFHMLYLQRAGRVLRVQDQEVHLQDVTSERAFDLARHYWVEEIRLEETGR